MARKAATRKVRRVGSARVEELPSRTPSAVDMAYQAIKADILSNRLRPGDPVPIEKYVKDLRLSRTPVREATIRLEREGLIEIRARMGTFVSHLDLRHIRDMYRVRRLLEGEAAREAALRAPIDELEQLRRELAAFSETGEIDTRGMSETGKRVHQLIVEHCENEELRRLILSLQDHFTRFRSLSIQLPEKVLSSHREHLAILDRLIARDPEGACALIHQHFDHASQFLLDSLLHGTSPARPRITIALP